MPVSGSTSLPIGGRNADWDGGAARARVVDYYTSDDGTVDWAAVKKGFFWIVPGKEDLKTGYRLGFADMVNGKLTALPHGLFAVAGGHGVQGTEGISEGDKNKIKKKVNTYYAKMKAKWPDDDFDFDPPFPEVKDIKEYEHMEITKRENPIPRLENLRKEHERVKAQLKSHLEQKFAVGGMGNASSFADLAAIDAIWDTIDAVFKTVWDFQFLAENIAWNSESPNAMLKGVKDLSVEMAAIFTKMAKTVPASTSEVEDQTEGDKALTNFINREQGQDWTIKQGKSSALLKNAKGDQFFYGRFTNNIWDKEGEVLITEAHQDFVDYLDSHPDEAPELWDWHEEDTAKSNKAVWWDFADGFLHCIWPVTDKEARGIEAFMEEFEPGMSHGFKVLERLKEDLNQIAKYRTKEASILPLEFAANEWTTFEILDQLKEMSLEERQKMFSPEKQRALDLLSLGEYKMPLGKASEADAAALDEAGAQRKDSKGKGNIMADENEDKVADQKTDAPAKTSAETPVEAPTAASSPTGFEEVLEGLQASTVEGFNLIMGQLKEITAQVQANTAALKGIKEKKGESPSVAAWVAAQKAGTAVGVEDDDDDKGGAGSGRRPSNGRVTDDDPLFGEGPEEEPFEIEGHLLNNF